MVEQKRKEQSRYPYLQGEFRHHGRRVFIPEQRTDGEGNVATVVVPKHLIPIEVNILAVIDYLTENDPRQPEVDGYSLIRQINPDLTVAKSSFGTFYRVLQRLAHWGFLESRSEVLPMGGFNTSRSTTKTLYHLSDYGRLLLEREGSVDQ